MAEPVEVVGALKLYMCERMKCKMTLKQCRLNKKVSKQKPGSYFQVKIRGRRNLKKRKPYDPGEAIVKDRQFYCQGCPGVTKL